MIWRSITRDTGYVEFRYALVGTYRLPDGRLVLIDSGTEEAPELLDDLERMGTSVRAVINTHRHVDHVANNRALAQRYGAEIYLPAGELTERRPEEEGIAFPACAIPGDARELRIDGVPFRLLPTPGHSPAHQAVITPDNVCFLGDAMMIGEYLRASKLPYMKDVDTSVISMEAIRETRFAHYAFAHKGVCTRDALDGVIDENIEKEIRVYTLLRQQVNTEMSAETLRERLKDALNISPATRDKPWLNDTIDNRIEALSRAGEIGRENGLVFPKK